MSNNNGDQKEEPKEVKLSISFSKEGLRIDAPGDGKTFDMPMCLFLLEGAKDYIKAHNQRAMKPIIEQAKPGMINRVKGAFGK